MTTHSNIYPAKKVLITFALLGGGIGGLLIGFGFCIAFIIEQINAGNLIASHFDFAFLVLPLLCFIYGSVIGCLPAFITACIIIKQKLSLATKKIYTKLFLIGSLVVVIPAILLAIGSFITVFMLCLFDTVCDLTVLDIVKMIIAEGVAIVVTIILALVGGICAMILGKFTLPKL